MDKERWDMIYTILVGYLNPVDVRDMELPVRKVLDDAVLEAYTKGYSDAVRDSKH